MHLPNRMADSEKVLKTAGQSHRVRAAGQPLSAQRAAQKTECDQCDRLDLLSSLGWARFPQSAVMQCGLCISQEGFKVGNRLFQAILEADLRFPA